MPPSRSGPDTGMGKDADTEWAQWLNRNKNSASVSRTPAAAAASSSSCPSTTSSSSRHDPRAMHARSTATNYFALLSAAQGRHHPWRQGQSRTPSPSMDASWVTWLSDRGSGKPMSEGFVPKVVQMSQTGSPSHSTTPASAFSGTPSSINPMVMEPESYSTFQEAEFLGDMDPMALDDEMFNWLNETIFPRDQPEAESEL